MNWLKHNWQLPLAALLLMLALASVSQATEVKPTSSVKPAIALVHEVQDGETCSGITARHGVPLDLEGCIDLMVAADRVVLVTVSAMGENQIHIPIFPRDIFVLYKDNVWVVSPHDSAQKKLIDAWRRKHVRRAL